MTVTSPPQVGLNLIKEFEGYHSAAYADPLSGGKPWTIAYGSTYDLNHQPFSPGDTCTKDEGEEFLNFSCEEDFLPGALACPYSDEFNDEMAAALMSFAYNLGAGFYGSPGFDTISNHLRNKDWELVPEAMLLYVNPGSNVEAGLTRRRTAEGDLWNDGLAKLDSNTSDNYTTITAVQATLLKKRPTQGIHLNKKERTFVGTGKSYKFTEIRDSIDGHLYVTLDYGAGSWYIYAPHWDFE